MDDIHALVAELGKESHFRMLFEAAPDSMIVADARGRIVLMNSQTERLFGYTATELVGQAVEVLLPDALRAAHVRHREGFAAAPRPRTMGAESDLMGCRRDKVTFPVEIALAPMKIGSATLTVASIRDVSESRRAREILRKNAQFGERIAHIAGIALRAQRPEELLGEIPAAVAQAVGADVAIVYLTDETKVTIRGAHGLTPAQIEELEAATNPSSMRAQVLRTGRAMRVNDIDAETTVKLNPVLRAAGMRSALAVPLISRGISLGALSATSKHSYRFTDDDLNFAVAAGGIVATAVGRLRAEAQLAHGLRLEAIGQLTGGIAHDFNNLLTIISGNLQMLEDVVSGESMPAKWMRAAMQATARGAALTRNLLLVARRETLKPEILDLSQHLPGLVDMLARTLGESITVRIEVQPDLPPCFVDPVQLDVMLINLALNARDAMPRGGTLTIEAEARISRREGGLALEPQIQIRVTDTGTGMAPEIRERAAHPFFTTKAPGKGSGLGLSMAHGFVAQSGGYLAIDSEPGAGTTVRIHLPAAVGLHAQSGDWAVSPDLAGGNECLLVVEDDAQVREVAVSFLSGFGYRVFAAGSAQAALRELEREPDIALVFSDIVLGGDMDGTEFARVAQARRPGMKVLLTTGHVRDEEAPAPGEFALLAKPYGREELARAIRAELDRPGRRVS